MNRYAQNIRMYLKKAKLFSKYPKSHTSPPEQISAHYHQNHLKQPITALNRQNWRFLQPKLKIDGCSAKTRFQAQFRPARPERRRSRRFSGAEAQNPSAAAHKVLPRVGCWLRHRRALRGTVVARLESIFNDLGGFGNLRPAGVAGGDGCFIRFCAMLRILLHFGGIICLLYE